MDDYRRRLDVLEDADSDFLSNVQEQNYRERIEVYNYTCVRRMVEPIAPQVPMDVTPQYATVPDTLRPGVAYSSQDLSLQAMSANAPLDPTTMPYGSSHLESNIASNGNNRSEPRSNWNGAWQSSFYASNVQYTSSTVRSERANLPHESANFGSHITRGRTQTAVIVAAHGSAYSRMEADSKQAPSTSQSWIGASYAASNTTICASQSWSNLGKGPTELGSDLAPRRTKAVGVVAPYSSADADSNLAPSTSQSEISAAYNASHAASITSTWTAQSRSNLANGSVQSGNIAPRTQTVGVVAPYSSDFTPTEADSNLPPSTSQSGTSASYAASNTSIWAAGSRSNLAHGSTQSQSNMWCNEAQIRAPKTEQARYNLAHGSTQPQSTMVSPEALHTSLNTTVRTAETMINLGQGSTQSQPNIASNEAQDTPHTTVGIAQSRSNLTTVTAQSNTGSNVAQHTLDIAVSSIHSRNLADTSERANVASDASGSARPQSQNIMPSSLRSQTSSASQVTPQASSSRDDETKRNFSPWDNDLRKHISITDKTEPHDSTARNEGRERTKRNCRIKMKYECKKCHRLRYLENMLHHLSTHPTCGIEEPNLQRDTFTHIVCPTCQASVKKHLYEKHVLKWHSRPQKKHTDAC